MKKVCILVTDAISFNGLYRGQLEFLRDNSEFSLMLISGGSKKELAKLADRNVGQVIDFGLKRDPSLFADLLALIKLSWFFIFNRFDLVIYSTPKALLLGSLGAALGFQKKRVAIIRGRAYENYTGKKHKAFAFLDKFSLLLSTEVLFISNSLKKLYLQEGLLAAKKATIIGAGSSNGVNTSKFLPSDVKSNVFTVAMVGRICLDKGIKDLAEILKRVKVHDISLRIYGSVEGDKSQAILDEIISAYSFVEYCGKTDSVQSVFKQAHLHLFLTHREGFGNVAIEAASCGIPTFAYDVVGVQDSVKEGVSGKHFKVGDYDAIAAAIDNASTDPAFIHNYSGAREWAIENFEQQAVWNNYLQFYQGVIDNHTRNK